MVFASAALRGRLREPAVPPRPQSVPGRSGVEWMVVYPQCSEAKEQTEGAKAQPGAVPWKSAWLRAATERLLGSIIGLPVD